MNTSQIPDSPPVNPNEVVSACRSPDERAVADSGAHGAGNHAAVLAHDALRQSGGSRREQHEAWVVFRYLHRRECRSVALGLLEHEHLLRCRRVRARCRGVHARRPRGVHHSRGRTARAVRRLARVDRRADQTGVQRTRDRDDRRVAVAAQERDRNRGIRLAVEERVRELVRAADDVGIREVLVAGVDRHDVGDRLDDSRHRLGNRELTRRQQMVVVPPERYRDVSHPRTHRLPHAHSPAALRQPQDTALGVVRR